MNYSVVIPTLGRQSVYRLLTSLAGMTGPRPQEIVVVADPAGDVRETPQGVQLLRSPRRGPAAARNVGWRATTSRWVAFLDDDVVVTHDWGAALASDLTGLAPTVAGSQGRIGVPLPASRRPLDWERSTAALEHARWATADMAYRRSALADVGGFDERFPRAYREDVELALRVLRAGYTITHGRRQVVHPVRPARFLESVHAQAGNADDALVRRLHGPRWRDLAGATTGRIRRHAAITAAGIGALLGARSGRGLATTCLLGWGLGTAEFVAARIAPGPRTPAEITRMLVTSLLIPPLAVWHRLRGEIGSHGARPVAPRAAAVIFDRDGTLVQDVPYNADPDAVRPISGTAEAVQRLRAAGVPVGVITNQSGVATGRLTRAEVEKVNARVDELVGPFDVWCVCPHGPSDGCRCRKPRAGLVEDAARALDVPAQRVVVIGDIGSDIAAAEAAGARGILVPSPATRPDEVATAPVVAADLGTAVTAILGGSANEEAKR